MFAEGYAAKARLFAKGRLKEGEMNRTEKAYSLFLEGEKRAGRVLAFWFESWKFKIAENACWYTPDFIVLKANGDLEAHEVKGSPRIFADDAKVKVKVCASTYPIKMKVVFPKTKKSGGGWDVQEF